MFFSETRTMKLSQSNSSFCIHRDSTKTTLIITQQRLNAAKVRASTIIALNPNPSPRSRASPSLPRPSSSPPSPVVASGPEPVVETMGTAPRGLPLDPARGQMFLEIGGYVEKKLHPLILDIEINRGDINGMKEDVGDATISYREMRELMAEQETRIDGLLCRVIHQERTIQGLQRQVEEFSTSRPALVAQAQGALALLAMREGQDVPAAAGSSPVVPSSSLSPPPSRVSLPPPSPGPFLPVAPPLPSPSAPATQPTTEEVEDAVSFGMSFLSHPFCQYDSLCMFCAV